MRKRVLLGLVAMALAGCETPVPNSAAGVGFGDYQTYLRQREAQLRGQPVAPAPTPAPVASTALTPPPGGGYGTAGYGATPVTAPAGQVAVAPEATATPQTTAAPGSIGAEALAALRATAPAAAPAAPAATTASVGAPLDAMAAAPALPASSAGPNLAAYALSATNAPGQAIYKRGGLKLASSERACARFVSPDLAQMDFLRRGGPERDPGNLDPDGDGFACGWDPRPFQTARQ